MSTFTNRKDEAMSTDTQIAAREKVRIYVTGDCEGLAELRHALARHGEIDLVMRDEETLVFIPKHKATY